MKAKTLNALIIRSVDISVLNGIIASIARNEQIILNPPDVELYRMHPSNNDYLGTYYDIVLTSKTFPEVGCGQRINEGTVYFKRESSDKLSIDVVEKDEPNAEEQKEVHMEDYYYTYHYIIDDEFEQGKTWILLFNGKHIVLAKRSAVIRLDESRYSLLYNSERAYKVKNFEQKDVDIIFIEK